MADEEKKDLEEELDRIIEEDEKTKDLMNKEKNELENVLKTDDGIRVLKRIIFGKCFVESSSYTGNIEATNFNLGRQSIGQELLNEIKNIDEEYVVKLFRKEKGE